MAEPTRFSRDQFLQLLDADDVEILWARWQLPDSMPPSRKAPEFRAALDARSTTTLLQEVLALRTGTLQMLREVLVFLESQGSSARTTRSLLVLNGEFDLGPQQVDAVLEWSERAMKRHEPATWEDLRQRLRAEITRLFRKIDEVGRVEASRQDPDYVDIHIRMVTRRPMSPDALHPTSEVKYDRRGLESRKAYVARLSEIDRRVHSARHRFPAEARGFITALHHFAEEQRRHLRESLSEVASADHAGKRMPKMRLNDTDAETWTRFEESVLFLSDVEETASLPDVLRMDLFRDRARLFEFWILVVAIRFLQRCGWSVDLLSLRTSADGREIWNLNYSRSQTPVARFTRKRDGTQSFLFYQLFSSGSESGNMPDIALMPSERPGDRPLWIIDPKHAEARSYSRDDYEEVAIRYHTTFHPQRTWIVEYYPRPRIGGGNPVRFAEGVSLIHDVSPGSSGHALLLDALREVHGSEAMTMAVVDVSGSFESRLAYVREDLRSQAARGLVLSDEILWFSDGAAVAPEPPSSLAGKGTRFTPVLDLIERLDREGTAPASLRIYTDGGFTDVTMDAALEQLRRRGDACLVDLDGRPC